MRTYRLHFSEEEKVLARRLEKAKASHAERVLCIGFPLKPAPRELFEGIWAYETETAPSSELLSGWDEVHFLVRKPEYLMNVNSSQIQWVLRPTHLSGRRAWFEKLKQFSLEDLQTKVFLEFEPWTRERAHAPTVHEVTQFIYELKYHFPEWKPLPRKGVELWDSRIPSYFEIEAGAWQEKDWNIQEATPKISVVIPTFNNKFFTYKVLEHLGRQTCDRNAFEVILVDDGSSDGTEEYLQTFGIPQGLQLRFLHWPRPHLRNRGDSFFRAGLARNLGVRRSRADRLLFLDSDIIVPESFIENVLKYLESADVIQFPRWHISQEKSSSKTKYGEVQDSDCYIEEENYWRPFFDSKNWMSLTKYWKYTCTYALALKKQDFIEAGRFKRFYVSYGFEDTELGYQLAKMGKKFLLASDRVLHLTSYTHSEYQMSQSKRTKLLQKTAKQFFLSTLDIENYHHFYGFMAGETAFWTRLKNGHFWKDKNRYFDEAGSSED